jgi:hypothetical protein
VVRKILGISFVLLHLSLVVALIYTPLTGQVPGLLGSGLKIYKNLTGIFRDYSYFAPSVGSDMKAGFFLETTDGRTAFLSFASDNIEIAFRYNVIVVATMRDPRARDLFAQSWAALLLGNRSDAARLTIVVKTFVVPTMANFRNGKQPEWVTLYAGEFERAKSTAAGREP